MPRFSANLGFLWTDLALPDAIHAAARAGFDAVECHWPYDTDPDEVRAALIATGLPMLGLNTRRGDVAAGDMGLAALPDRSAQALANIEEAITYARAIDAGAVHVMAGNAQGEAAHAAFVSSLRYATSAAPDLTILIEPLNRFDAPNYFLRDSDQAVAIIDEIDAPNLKLMFDCYHVGRTEGDVLARLPEVYDKIGHIQFASVPDRGPPMDGEVDYSAVFTAIDQMGWPVPLGAEYRAPGDPVQSLGWMLNARG